jgi:hypothetical protein
VLSAKGKQAGLVKSNGKGADVGLSRLETCPYCFQPTRNKLVLFSANRRRAKASSQTMENKLLLFSVNDRQAGDSCNNCDTKWNDFQPTVDNPALVLI